MAVVLIVYLAFGFIAIANIITNRVEFCTKVDHKFCVQ
jgi:hypothetical protein